MNRHCGRLFLPLLLVAGPIAQAQEQRPAADLDQVYAAEIRPLIEHYCGQCHTGALAEADLDLSVFRSAEDVRKQVKSWLMIRRILLNEQMPPEGSPQPTDMELARLQAWVRDFLAREAESGAGDPGPIVLRRLSNAEYTYAIHDLTGVDTLEPTEEFPIDGAAGEGFTNVGSGQGMSPALIQKYLDAAKGVAEHAVLLPDGIRFSPSTTRRDQTDQCLARIQSFYRRFTADGGGTAVNLQGIRFETNQGGLLPVGEYLAATLAHRDALLSGRGTIEQVAAECGLNARYLALLWKALTRDDASRSILLDAFRERWRGAGPDDLGKLTAEIERTQKALWKFNSIGQFGREGGPTRWMEAVAPIVTSQELRLPLPDVPPGSDVVITLAAHDLDDGNEHDFVVWQRPRIEFKSDGTGSANPPVWLRDVRQIAGQVDRTIETESSARDSSFGLAPNAFGTHPDGSPIAPTDLCVRAPQRLEIHLPRDLAAGGEFVATAALHGGSGTNGSVQLQVQATKLDAHSVSGALPILVHDAPEPRQRVEAAMDEYRALFPLALCYARIVPVDEVVTLTLYYREDDHLKRLMLDDAQAAELDRLWDKLYWISEEPLQLVVALEQITEFATQDRPDLVKAFAPLREPIQRRAEAFQQRLAASEPEHVQAIVEFAQRAWRRPLTEDERQGLRRMYQRLRDEQIPHADAIRLTLARVLTSPAFLYKLEQPGSGSESHAVSDRELASRLSFFLWSSVPDDPLWAAAESGRLSDDAERRMQTHRMLNDPRARRLAVEFACQWLHLRGFDRNDDKNESLFPEFAALRGDMYEETVRFFEDMFRNDGSILDILDADHTFLNELLARHYGIVRVAGSDWRRVDGLRAEGRGGVLGMATYLASQSGASRTSPILRGNWVYETLLGERLPRPPAGVPQLPEALPRGLTARELIERHTSEAACAKCHAKIDPYGFALEQYDAIGRLVPDPVDTKTTLPDGRSIEGIDGLRAYLSTDRREDFVRQFCRKLLGYALGREVQLSDEPLLAEMQRQLRANGYRFRVAVEVVVSSPQFRNIRGRAFGDE
ncbi:MAG: DUF1592 domain-containing protein [Pirellulaceae bacterium]|nr:DUF1592 domain-containing protein [Pirellulaceae bacterium]